MPSITKLRQAAKNCVGEFARSTGYEIKRVADSFLWVSRMAPKTILDIGANEGQFATKARAACPGAMIHSFEPIPAVYNKLRERFSGDSKFEAHNVGLGEVEGTLNINRNEFSPSSSLLALSPEHISRFPFATQSTVEEVKVLRLDGWAAGRELPSPMIAKIDVQGYEERVIAGAAETLRRCSMVIIEVSFVELYTGQILFDELQLLMNRNNFRCAGLLECYSDPTTGESVYADAIYIPRSLRQVV